MPTDEHGTPGSASDERPALPLRTKIVFMLVTLVAILALLEGASRLLIRIAPNARWELRCQHAKVNNFEVMNEILMADENLFWRLRPNLDRFTLSGQLGNMPPIHFSVSTNSESRRCMPPVGGAHNRVLFVGDSTTFGFGVEDSETVPVLIQQRLSGTECINAGVPGYSAFQGRRWLEGWDDDGPLHAVVITFGFNDELTWDHLSDIEHSRLIEGERSRFINKFRLFELLQHLLPKREESDRAQKTETRPRLSDDEFTEQIVDVIEWCRERGAEPILLVWPKLAQITRGGATPKQAVLRKIARNEGVAIVDLVPLFRAHKGSGFGKGIFIDVVHASPAGCRLIADALMPVLQKALE